MNTNTTAKSSRVYEVWMKDTKKGVRYFTWSISQMRTFPVAKAKAEADILSGAATLTLTDWGAVFRGEAEPVQL